MRILHTSDWHLGQEFHGFPREAEHQAFLHWLADTLEQQTVDALLVTGDIYDSQNPPIAAQKQLYEFIAHIRTRLPRLDVVLVGGNHDSAGRLEAPGPLLQAFGVRVIGSLPRRADGSIDIDQLTIPLHDAHGRVAAWCAAVPFLRQSDLPVIQGDDALIQGVRQIYDQVLTALGQRAQPGQATIATGHCYMTGCALSELSERRILGGNQHALPVDIFPPWLSYAALGHLHKAQMVGGRPTVRYCGSPLPLSVTEREYRHQVLLVELTDGQTNVTSIDVPRLVPILRVPNRGTLPPDQAIAALRAMAAPMEAARHLWPYLHVAVGCDGPTPSLRRDIEDAIQDQGLRLARIDRTDNRDSLDATPPPAVDLEDLHPEDVFIQCWQRSHADTPPADYLAAFRTLLEEVEQQGRDTA